MKKILGFSLIGLLFFVFSADADVLYLRNGTSVEGDIVFQERDFVTIKVGGRMQQYVTDTIRFIEKDGEYIYLDEEKDQPEVGVELESASPSDAGESFESLALLDELIQLMGIREKIESQLDKALSRLPLEQRGIVEEAIDINEIVEKTKSVYEKYYSIKELKELVEFYRSETGQKLLNVTENFSRDVMGVMAEYLRSKLYAN